MDKKEAKTRTSITIDPAVLDALRKHCESANVSVSSFIENCVSASLALVPDTTPSPEPVIGTAGTES
jgi:hypothetical protein